jgi:acyl carrier protein
MIFNEYGPTECTITSSIKNITKESNNYFPELVTIGKPLCNYEMYILDEYMKPVPVGVEGEIYIGGKGVGNGYLNKEELTNERFLPNPFRGDPKDKFNKIYKTGDIGKWAKDGEIICLGRMDFQVKIHGQRIELGEIEGVMKEIEEIESCVVIDKLIGNDKKFLIGYYIIRNGKNIGSNEIRNYMKRKLPLYMVPNYFIEILEFPITSNGKLDRKALPEPTESDLILNEYVEAETKTEKKLVTLYSKVLHIKENKISKTSDFYELGGDSLIAIRLITEIQKEFQITIGMKSILKNETVELLGKYIDDIKNRDGELNEIIEIIPSYSQNKYPITSQQMGVYLDSVKNANSIIYNIPNIYKLNEAFDITRLKESIMKLISKHRVLKSIFKDEMINEEESKIFGIIDKEFENKFKFEEYSIENSINFVRPFNLEEGPLIRVGFIEDQYLLIDIHHILLD